MKKIVIAGATGLVGKKLISKLINKNFSITILTRNIESAKSKFGSDSIKFINWDYFVSSDKIVEHLEDSFAVINLAGSSIGGKKWNDEYKKIIYDSRIVTTRKISEAISKCKNRPPCFINSSAGGYYGKMGEEVLNEEFPNGNDYLAKICNDWEKEALSAEKYGVRVVTLRIGIVLDKNEGAFPTFLPPFKVFMGGHHGTGKQWITWIHIDDMVNLITYALENSEIKGALNCTSPNPVTDKVFCKTIGKVLHRPSFFTVPGFIMKLSIGEFADYILESRKMLPYKALKNGFKFQYEEIDKALINLLK
jgi:uncharacterized protein